MLDMKDLTQAALIAFLGFALIKVGTYLVRLYERSMQADPRKVMWWDLFSVLAAGPFSPAFTLGVLCISGGVIAMIAGGLLLIFSLFPLFV